MSGVSVVIRVRNSPGNLRLATTTVRETAPEAELVIVDNDSSDDTAAIAATLADVMTNCSGTVGDCARTGAERASGDILFFMDADQRLLKGTVEAACRALESSEAVIVPERPARTGSLWASILAAERAWAEASGLGLPRVFWREKYLAYAAASGVAFGEDRIIARQVHQVAHSFIPILHEEPRSPADLVRKYYRYGRKHRGASGATDPLGHALTAYLSSVTTLPANVRVILPAVVLLKIAKASAFYAGSVRASTAHWIHTRARA